MGLRDGCVDCGIAHSGQYGASYVKEMLDLWQKREMKMKYSTWCSNIRSTANMICIEATDCSML